MLPFSAVRTLPEPTRIHPALRSFGDECGDAFVKLLAYVGVLAILAATALLAATHSTTLFEAAAVEPAPRPDFVPTPRSPPAFAVSQLDFAGKTETYQVLRHREGGRKDVLRWGADGEPAAAELEIYRPGAEAGSGLPPLADLAARMDPGGTREIQTAGVIDSKFGTVTLLSLTGRAAPAASCLGFLKRFEQPRLLLSGWSCQGQGQPEQRAAIGCLLDRLVQLSAGNDAAIAGLFARAELHRTGCAPAPAGPATAENWVTAAPNPRLRGSL
jgi:hypothetical protein